MFADQLGLGVPGVTRIGEIERQCLFSDRVSGLLTHADGGAEVERCGTSVTLRGPDADINEMASSGDVILETSQLEIKVDRSGEVNNTSEVFGHLSQNR